MLPNIPTIEIVFTRSLITLIIAGFILFKNKIPIITSFTKILVLRGVFGVISLTLFFYTLKNAPLAHAVTIVHLSPIFTVLFAIFIVGEKPQLKQWPYIFVAFIGVALLKNIDPRFEIKFVVTGVLAAMFAGLAYNCIRLLKDKVHHQTIVFYFPLIAIPLTLLDSPHWVIPNTQEFIWIIINGIATLLGQVYMTKGYLSSPASKVSHFNFLAPIYAVIFGLFLFQETLNSYSYLGLILIGIGIFFTSKYSHQN